MSYVGGDLIEVTWNHNTLGDGSFFIKGGEDASIDTGGFRSEDDNAAVAGDGQMIDKINRKRWSVEAPIAWDRTVKNEIEHLAELAADPLPATFTFSDPHGTIWSGYGKPVGDIVGSTQDATVPMKISGGGRLSKIS